MQETPYGTQEETLEVVAVEAPAVAEGVEEVVEEIPGSTPVEVAQLLGGEEAGWSGRRVRRYIRSETFPATKYGGRWRMTDEQIEEGLGNLETKAAEKAAAKEAEEKAAAEKEAATTTAAPAPAPVSDAHGSNEPF